VIADGKRTGSTAGRAAAAQRHGLPKFEPSILNCTVPLGVPAPGAFAPTVTVKLTLCPNTDGVSDEPTTLVVLALFTVWVKSADVLVRKFPSPLYSAVITCGPTDKEAIARWSHCRRSNSPTNQNPIHQA
jgi:hypothetical protein